MPVFTVRTRVVNARVDVNSGIVVETSDGPVKPDASERVEKRTMYDVLIPPSNVYDTHDSQADASACATQQTQITSQWEREATADARARGEIV